MTPGGENVRDLQLYLSPQAEHLLDWFHVTMRLTVLQQLRKELGAVAPTLPLDEVTVDLDRIKWCLWHGNVFRTLQLLDDVHDELDAASEEMPAATKLTKAVREFRSYIGPVSSRRTKSRVFEKFHKSSSGSMVERGRE